MAPASLAVSLGDDDEQAPSAAAMVKQARNTPIDLPSMRNLRNWKDELEKRYLLFWEQFPSHAHFSTHGRAFGNPTAKILAETP
jgi:hypothetical protein